MLLILLISVMLEAMLQHLIYQDRAMSTRCEYLKGKLLRFELAEWETPFILVFGEHQVDVLNVWDDIVDCTVRTRLAVLPILLAHKQLTQFIKQGFLDVDGDQQCIQHFATLLDMTEFNAAELLAPWVGDIAAEGITQVATRLLSNARRLLRISQGQIAQAINDEWCLAPSSLELAWFCDEVDDVTRAGENLVDRLDKLEANK